MTDILPEYLFPLSSAIKWQEKITLESLAESYNSFVLTMEVASLNKKNSSRTPEERILSFLQTKHITIPNQIALGSPAVTVFLKDYQSALDSVWDVKNGNNKKFLSMVEREYSFQAPTKPNGQGLSENELMVLEYFERPQTHAFKMDRDNPKQFDVAHFANQLPTYYSFEERKIASYYLNSLMPSLFVESKYKGSSEKKAMKLYLSVVAVFSLIIIPITTTISFADSGKIPADQIVLVAVIAGLCGVIFSVLIGPFISAFLALLIDRWFPKTHIMSDDTYHFYKIALTPQGAQLVREGRAWRNYVNTRLPKGSEEKPTLTKDIYRSKTGTFIRVPINPVSKRKTFNLKR